MNAKLQELIALLRDKEGGVKEIEVLLTGDDIKVKVKYFSEAEKHRKQSKTFIETMQLYNSLPAEFTWKEAKQISRKAHNTQLSRLLSNEEYFIKVSQGNYKKVNRNYGGIDQVPNS